MTEVERTLLIADLAGYTALTETHGALHASEVVLQFDRMAEASLEPGVAIVDRVGDQVLCAGAETYAVLGTALRLFRAVEQKPGFLALQAGVHRGPVIERDGRLFGAALNMTARLAARARAGQILCTAQVAAEASRHPGMQADFLGEQRFKNVSVPVMVYDLRRASGAPTSIDPVCQMRVDCGRAPASVSYQGEAYCFCSHECASAFRAAPERYARLWG
jgi:class 3 adenylate cyclase/YHS domain-containing protein